VIPASLVKWSRRQLRIATALTPEPLTADQLTQLAQTGLRMREVCVRFARPNGRQLDWSTGIEKRKSPIRDRSAKNRRSLRVNPALIGRHSVPWSGVLHDMAGWLLAARTTPPLNIWT